MRGMMSRAIRMPATASARYHPRVAIRMALAMTPTEPSASLTTSRDAARMFRFRERSLISTSSAAMLATRPTIPKNSRLPDAISGGSNRRRMPSTSAKSPTPSSSAA
ncbi:hypothetical protein GCM10010461_06150 [Microbacterium aurantiacum]